MIGKALDIGRAETLTVPPWAVSNFSRQPLNPLDMYAGSRLAAFGLAGAQGKRIMPWRRRKLANSANQVARGAGMIYSPMGYGRMQ